MKPNNPEYIIITIAPKKKSLFLIIIIAVGKINKHVIPPYKKLKTKDLKFLSAIHCPVTPQ